MQDNVDADVNIYNVYINHENSATEKLTQRKMLKCFKISLNFNVSRCISMKYANVCGKVWYIQDFNNHCD